MEDVQSLSHAVWECKYHVVWIPKYRRKTLYAELRRHLGEVFQELAQQRESKVLEGHLKADHVHMLISIPPKYAVAQVVGFIKGKSAIHIARAFGGWKRNFTGQHFWARGYYVSTVGKDESTVREYIILRDVGVTLHCHGEIRCVGFNSCQGKRDWMPPGCSAT